MKDKTNFKKFTSFMWEFIKFVSGALNSAILAFIIIFILIPATWQNGHSYFSKVGHQTRKVKNFIKINVWYKVGLRESWIDMRNAYHLKNIPEPTETELNDTINEPDTNFAKINSVD